MSGATITDWAGCYEGGWQGMIHESSWAHPAKFSNALITRIIRHGLDKGYWKEGDVIGDCFGGVGLGGIVAAYYGLKWIGVELERDFCTISKRNFLFHVQRGWCVCGLDNHPYVQSLQQSVHEETSRSGAQPTARDEALLFEGVLEKEPERNEAAGKEPELVGREVSESERLHRDSGRRQEEVGAHQPNGTAPREKAKPRRSGPPPKRGQDRQSNRESQAHDNEQSHAPPQPTRTEASCAAADLSDLQQEVQDDCSAPRGPACVQSPGVQEAAAGSLSEKVSGEEEASTHRDRVQYVRNEIHGETEEACQAADMFVSGVPSGVQQSLPAGSTCPCCGKLIVHLPVILNGDSREFARLVGSVAGAVTSPPYAETGELRSDKQAADDARGFRQGAGSFRGAETYGQTPGQIGSLKSGDLSAVITSPPYAESITGDHAERETAAESTAKRRTPGGSLGRSARHGGYGVSKGQIGALKEGQLCESVESAARLSANAPSNATPADSSCFPISTSSGIEPQSTDAKLPLASVASPGQKSQASEVSGGKAVAIGIEAKLGASAGERSLSETAISAESADAQQSSSTTSRRRKKQAVSGTTQTGTLKPAATDATPRTTQPKSGSAESTAQSADQSTSPAIQPLGDARLNAVAYSTPPRQGSSGHSDQPHVGGALDAVVTSPPYVDGLGHGGHEPTETDKAKGLAGQIGGYGSEAGNIGNLKEGVLDGVVSSPPFAKQSHHGGDTEAARGIGRNSRGQRPTEQAGNHNLTRTYGASDGQIDELTGETYWQAMRQVYSQMHLVLRPGAVACIVVKDYVSKKQRVPLCDNTCLLLESLGFTVFERCRCWLVKEDRQPDLWGGESVKKTERKSFFRRLAEKNGSPRIDYEEAIWCRT